MYSANKVCDRRSFQTTKRDFDRGFRNEGIVMDALVAYYYSRDISSSWEKIDKTEKFLDGVVHFKPDVFFSTDEEDFTFEIKANTSRLGRFTETEIGEFVYVKPYSLWTMQKDPISYPGGSVFVCNNRHFAIMSADRITKYPLVTIHEWGMKQAYVIEVGDFEWQQWNVPLDLTQRLSHGSMDMF